MKIAFKLLMCLAAATLLPIQAATKVTDYEQAQAKLTDDGYLLFIYGQGWDKRSEKLTKELGKLAKTPYGAAESVVLRNYLDTCLELPWAKEDLYV